jgi:hypothetical protein
LKITLLFLLLTISCNNVLAKSAEFVQCFDFGCKSTKEFSFNQDQWKSINDIFTRPALSAWIEKQQIRQAVALMEIMAGSISGTSLDKGGNYSGIDLPFQQDCIDESTNTYQYLQALQLRNLLHWHQVAEKKRRIIWFATHWTAVIREHNTNQQFAVDSWYRDNGDLPYIQKIENWLRKSSFSDSLNP